MKIHNFKNDWYFIVASLENKSMKQEIYGKFVKNVFEKFIVKILTINLHLTFQDDC